MSTYGTRVFGSISYLVSSRKCGVVFFRQMTAYEVRISDWSSDVCSSDLFVQRTFILTRRHRLVFRRLWAARGDASLRRSARHQRRAGRRGRSRRSEEHTSELQSLMRISYAVFCLKKKKLIDTNNQYQQNDTCDKRKTKKI